MPLPHSKISARLTIEPLALGPPTEVLLLAAASQDRPAILEILGLPRRLGPLHHPGPLPA